MKESFGSSNLKEIIMNRFATWNSVHWPQKPKRKRVITALKVKRVRHKIAKRTDDDGIVGILVEQKDWTSVWNSATERGLIVPYT